MAVGKKLLSVFFSFTLVMGLLPYSAFADPSDSSSNSTESSSDASTSNESEFADGGVASKPDPGDSEGGMDSSGSVSGGEDAGFGVDDEFANEQELSAPDYSDGKLAIWVDGLDDPSDIADVYPPDTNEIEAYANGSNLQPMSFSSEMLYFCKYESSCNYDQGLSSGDGYHAMGYFQFDNRYGLGSFLKAAYNYNPSTYSALKVIGDRYGWDVTGATRSNGAFTQLGNDLNTAWHAAYKANPTEFSNLQNGWAYIDSYNGSLGARGCLKAFGINLDNRPDCIKGLCWGMVNLFGAGGGASYINNGNYYGANWFFKNSGINDSMSDEAFVTTLCDYVVNNVVKRYPKQSVYWTGWQNRYKSEKADCLRYIQSNIYPIEDNFVSINKAPNSVSDGQYLFKSELDGMGVLQVGSNGSASETSLKICSSTMGEEQKFVLERDSGSGYVRIKNMQSSRYLGLVGSSGRYSQAVVQKEYSVDDKTLLWQIAESGGALVVKPAINTDYCLDVTGGSFYEGVSVCLYKVNGGANQRFSLVSTNIAPVSESEDFGFEGWYEISPVADSSLCVDIFNASSDNGAKSLLYNKNSNLNQLFKLEYQNGFYRLISASSGKALELKDGSVIPGVPAQQRAISDSMSQKWKITKNQDGSYSFACAANGLMLGSAEVDSNVSLSGRDGGAGENISFFLTKRTDLLKEGVFKIAYGKDQGKVVDIDNASRADGANALIYSSNSNLNQKWKVKLVSGMENTYTFESLCSGKYLSVSGSNVVQSSFSDGSGEQMWTPVDIDAGAVVLQNIATGKVLDVKGGSNSNGTNVQVYERNNSTAQKFIFEPTELVKTATYVFHSGANYGQVVDLNNASTQDGATVTTWTSNNGGNQKWNLSGNGDGTYRISNAANGKVLDVSGGTVSDGTRVAQYSWHNGLNQKWYVAYDKEGGFVFESAQNRDVVLAVGSPSPSDGASIRVEKKTGAANQRFCLEQTVYTPPMPSDRQAMQNKIWGYGSGTQWLIGVDRSTHRVGVFRGSANNWTLQYWWSCVTGAPSTPTITGYYRTTGGKRMSLSTDSRAKWCTQIWNGYFFHTILNSDAELGNSLSHGCLRMSYPSAQWIYSNIYAGTTVVIYN